jgi:predicted transcriptional regulator
MTRGKQTDAEIKALVIEAKVNNPDLSSRDIAELLKWVVSYDTICDILNKDLPQVATQSSRIASLIDTNNNIQSLTDALIVQKLASKEEVIRLSELTSLRDSTFKQNQLLTGKNTENAEIKIKWET